MAKWVMPSAADGRGRRLRDLLGGKGANLAEMANLGLPVPPGFTITTEVCTYFYAHGRTYPADLAAQVDAALAARRRADRRGFGDSEAPLLVSVRSGRPRLDARHDGHRPQPRAQRCDRGGPGAVLGRRALRLRQLPPLHPDVLQRGARPRRPRVRGDPRESTRSARATSSTPT